MVMQLHRDQEVGVISGELEKEGFYGTEFTWHGFAYRDVATKNEEIRMFASEDEVKAAVALYNVYLQGFAVAPLQSKSHRFYGEEERLLHENECFKEQFCKELLIAFQKNNVICRDHGDKSEYLLTKENVQCYISGFAFLDNQHIKVRANAYFPQTLKWWVDKKLIYEKVTEIVFQERSEIETPALQLKQFKETLKQESFDE